MTKKEIKQLRYIESLEIFIEKLVIKNKDNNNDSKSKKHISKLESEVKHLENSVDELEGEIDELEGEVNGLEGQNDDLRLLVSTLKAENSELKGTLISPSTETCSEKVFNIVDDDDLPF